MGAVLLFCAVFPSAQAGNAPSLRSLIEETFDAKLSHKAFFEEDDAGSSVCDWIALAMGRYGIVYENSERKYYYDAPLTQYADAAEKYLREFYESSGVSSGVKLTDYFRTAIALTALGRDVSDIIRAASLNNPKSVSKLAVLTVSYGLVCLELTGVEEDEETVHTRREFIERLVSLRHDDGGWSLTPGESDVDVTSMVLQGLAPFYRKGSFGVEPVVEKALAFLSTRQRSSGDFVSYGTFNAESTAQVIVALTQLGIDVLSDSRFIKENGNALDGLLLYRLEDGSFTHSFTSDPENTSAVPGSYNYLATDQAAYALVALWRQQAGLRPLYDMCPDITGISKNTSDTIINRMIELIRMIVLSIASKFSFIK